MTAQRSKARPLGLRLAEPSFGYLSEQDRRLVREAIILRCDAFLTVERRLRTVLTAVRHGRAVWIREWLVDETGLNEPSHGSYAIRICARWASRAPVS